MNRVSFSVLMSVYDGDDHYKFNNALDSIFKNTISPNQFILVVDGPINKNIEFVIDSYLKYEILQIVYIEKNIGLAGALNHGLKFITSEWVFRADADDINIMNRFKIQLENLEDCNVVGGQIYEFNNNILLSKRIVPLNHMAIRKFLVWRNPMNHMTVAFKYSLYEMYGGYPDILYREDYAYWSKLMAKGAIFKNLDEILVYASVTDDFYNRRTGLKYLSSDIKLQFYQYSLEIKNFSSVIISIVFKFILYSLPITWLKLIYKFVRKV